MQAKVSMLLWLGIIAIIGNNNIHSHALALAGKGWASQLPDVGRLH
jgi:hypothetical protein